jgi:spore coat protein U-like protein|tara:strand:+ start:2148 stop:2681 length:534 start_codon:yes stop_codon:yes gene_type:complete
MNRREDGVGKTGIRTTCSALAGACALAGLSSPAAAAPNGSQMQIGAQVEGRCSVSTTDMAFGVLDTKHVTRVDTNATVSVSCAGLLTFFRLTMDWGQNASGEQRRIKNASNDYLPYEVYRNNNRTQRWGQRNSESRTGVILLGIGNEDFEAYGRLSGITPSTPKGRYTDQLTVTITF